MNKIRWGILGCGKIANKFAADLKLVTDATLTAVGSRDIQRSNDFAKTYGAPYAFDSYEALVSSNEVDVIYVATPHGFHYEHVLLCLNHGKAVLCEKALALNSRQVKEMIEMSRRKKVFLMEAFWTKFLPQYQRVKELIGTGSIGDVRWIQADFGFMSPDPVPQRLYDPLLGGGALLDIGIYPVFLALSILGRPDTITAEMEPCPSGVDKQIAITMRFATGALATLSATFDAETPVEAAIAGSKGYIKIKNRFHNATSIIELATGKETPQEMPVPRESGYGYQFEARHVTACVRDKLIESPVMSHQDSLLLMETLDRIRQECGIVYPADGN